MPHIPGGVSEKSSPIPNLSATRMPTGVTLSFEIGVELALSYIFAYS